jgi:hypothetical protein
MALFDTIAEQIEIGPASVIDTGTTASSGNSEYTMKGVNEGWNLFVRPGDLVVLLGNVNDSALVMKVEDANTLILSKPIAANNTPFRILRPTECTIRPHIGWEWEIHTIMVTPRIDAGADENLHLYPVEVWSTDDNKPKTLLFTTQDYVARSQANYPHLAYQLRRHDITIKPTYFSWLLVRNYQPVRVDLYFNGIDKTVVREEE